MVHFNYLSGYVEQESEKGHRRDGVYACCLCVPVLPFSTSVTCPLFLHMLV